jgi:hemoglobin
MRFNHLGRCGLLLAALLFAPVAWAADEKKDDTKSLDKKIDKALVEAIDIGYPLYNEDPEDGSTQTGARACYHVFRTAIVTLRPFLEDRPKYRRTLEFALTAADKEKSWQDKAWTLRKAMDEVRKSIKGGGGVPKATLWQRLGGEPKVKKSLEDFLTAALKDRKIDLLRGGKYKIADRAALTKQMVDYVSQISGGPHNYKGKDMKTVHKGMGITDLQFDAAAAALRKAFQKNGVPADAIKDLMALISGTRNDIVEAAPKKNDDSKKPEKKPDDKTNAQKPTKVEGKLVYKGKPVGDVKVWLNPEDSSQSDIYVSTSTKSDGTFTIAKAVRPGKYRVVLSTAPGASKNPLPEKYTQLEKTPLVVEVKEGKKANLKLEIKD